MLILLSYICMYLYMHRVYSMFGCFMNLSAYLCLCLFFYVLYSLYYAVLCVLRQQLGLLFSVNYMLFHQTGPHIIYALLLLPSVSDMRTYEHGQNENVTLFICSNELYTNILSGQKQKF